MQYLQEEFMQNTKSRGMDYRLILKNELENRCSQNPRYSLRAFARDLELSPSRLSEILNYKQGLSPKYAEKIASTLGYSGDEFDLFCDLVKSLHARSNVERETATLRLDKYQKNDQIKQLESDAFKFIADWYHLAILELISMNWFKNDTRWIAKTLGITEIQADLAIERLIRLKLLEKQGDRLNPLDGEGNVPGGIPSESIKKFHTQILEQSKKAIYLQDIKDREFRVSIMAIDKSKINEAKKEIEKFQHKFCNEIYNSEKKDGLYCFAVQFFSLERT